MTSDKSLEITNPQSIADNLNKHFVNKGPKLASKLPVSNTSVLEGMGVPNPSSMEFHEISTNEIVNIVNQFENKKSSGHDNIPSILIKWIIDFIAPILSSIFNDCVEKGIYPNCLKIAKVTPLFKSGDVCSPDNYRPISVLPQVDKIFEKLIHKRMVEFEAKHKFLNNCQFGFRKGHSTSHGITHVHEQVIQSLEKKKVCALLFIDLKAAFDTVNVEILLTKLQHYGYRGKILKLLTSYLHDRKQFVFSDSISSCLLDVLCGVPQGSVLGPLLFIIYINDISNSSDADNSLFADDAALLVADSNVKKLKKKVHKEINSLHKWLIRNKLTLNLSKTKYMLFANKNKLTDKSRKKFQITIAKYTIHEVDYFKYLGVLIDRNLNWNHHAEYLLTKLSSAAGAMFKTRKYLSTKTLKLIYHSLAGSYLQYGISAWSNCSSTMLNKLQSMQNKIIRCMTFSQPHSNIDTHYTRLKILKISELKFYETAKFMHSVYNNRMPLAFQDYFQEIDHTYETRTRTNIGYYLPFPRTERGKKSLRYTAVHIWADIPHSFRDYPVKLFKTSLKNYILCNAANIRLI